MTEIAFHMVSFTDVKTKDEFMAFVKSKLGEGINEWVSAKTKVQLIENIQEVTFDE